jgi:DNA-binding transcriptional LysR family regulator/tetratricopeptide (TPR) repeat protein
MRDVTRDTVPPENGDPMILFAVWNWLPAFYAVAQTQHLPTASKRLRLSISALSRTIRLLEAAIGRALFRRAGRNLELNCQGQELLSAVERSIGVLAPQLDRLTASGFASPLHIGIVDPLSQGVVMPVLRGMQSEHKEFVPYLHGCADGGEASKLLLAGDLDLALSSHPLSEKALAAESLGQFSNGVYCGLGHPLFNVSATGQAVILRHPFVGCFPRATAWPTHLPRKIGVYVNHEETAVDLCLGGEFLAVLPDATAHPYVRHGALWRLPLTDLSATSLFVAWRLGDDSRDRIGAVVSALRHHLAGLESLALQTRGVPGVLARRRSQAIGAITSGEDEWRFGDSLLVRAEYRAAQGAYRAALHRLAGSAHERANYLLRRARMALMLAQYAAACRYCRRVLTLDTLPSQRAIAESMLAIVHCYRGELPLAGNAIARARVYLEEARSVSQVDGLKARVAVARAEGTLSVVSGQPLRALRCYTRGEEAAERLSNQWDHSIALGNIADAYLHARNSEDALTYFDRAAQEKEVIGDRWGMCYLHHGRAFVFLERGQVKRAIREAAVGLKLAMGVSDLKLVAMLNILLGRAHLAESDLKSAQRAFRFALTAATRCKARYETIQATIGLVDVELRKGDVQAALDRAIEAQTQATRTGSKDALAAALATRAAVHLRRRRNEKARQLLASARKLAFRPPQHYGFWFTASGS